MSILLLTVLLLGLFPWLNRMLRIVGSTIVDGESNWLEGAALMSAYMLIAVSLWYL